MEIKGLSGSLKIGFLIDYKKIEALNNDIKEETKTEKCNFRKT